MSGPLAFWTAAWLDLGAVVVLALLGWRHIRRGAWISHRRCMRAAVVLVALFLVAYLLKVEWMGHEDTSAWSAGDHLVLYVHEAGITAMLVGGALALWRAHRFRDTLPAGPQLPAHDESSRERGGHRWAGRIAVAGAVTAWLTSALMLAGMYGRAA